MVHLTWSFGGHFDHDTQDILHYIEDVDPLMWGVAPPDDWIYHGTPSHTSWTLDNGHMSLDIVDMVILAIRWVRSPHLGQCTLEPHYALI